MKYRLNAATISIPDDAPDTGLIVELPQNIIVLAATCEPGTMKLAFLEPMIEPTV